jgi:hypothetical protein
VSSSASTRPSCGKRPTADEERFALDLHLEDGLAAEQLSLSEDQISRLEEPYVTYPVSGIDL